jgi:hypothetical protein
MERSADWEASTIEAILQHIAKRLGPQRSAHLADLINRDAQWRAALLAQAFAAQGLVLAGLGTIPLDEALRRQRHVVAKLDLLAQSVGGADPT